MRFCWPPKAWGRHIPQTMPTIKARSCETRRPCVPDAIHTAEIDNDVAAVFPGARSDQRLRVHRLERGDRLEDEFERRLVVTTTVGTQHGLCRVDELVHQGRPGLFGGAGAEDKNDV